MVPLDVRFELAWAGDTDTPVGLVVVIETWPAKPPLLVRVMLEFLPATADRLRELGLAAIVKPVVVALPMNVDQQDPKVWQDPVVTLWYSPANHTVEGSDGSSPAPK